MLLYGVKRFRNACKVEQECVGLTRNLYALKPNDLREVLARALHNYGLSLRARGRTVEADRMHQESLELGLDVEMENEGKLLGWTTLSQWDWMVVHS